MNQKGPIGAALVLVLLGGVSFFILKSQTDSREAVQQVEEILRTPQTYDGEKVDRLARIGPAAIPAVGEALAGNYQWPGTLLIAIREIGDPRGAEPILSFIQSRSPYSDTDSSFLTADAIRALGSIPHPIVCEPLADIFEDASSHPRIRLTSAATVFRSCEGEVAVAAENLLLEFHRDRRKYGVDVNEGFHEAEVHTALMAAAASDEIAAILIGVMNNSPYHDSIPRIIESIDGRRAEFPDALMFILNAPYTPFETRLLAAQRLLDLGERTDALRIRMEELLREAEANEYPQRIVDEARQLKRNSESQLLD